jgi:hypothetical protein
VISTLKQCEDDDRIVVRYFDMEGKQSQAELRFFQPIESVQHTNIIEEEGQTPSAQGQALRLPSKPYSIDTVKLSRKMPRRRLVVLPHSDAMEYQDQADAESAWKRYSSYRPMVLTSEQNHTPGGSKSLKSGGIMDFASMTLPAITNLSVRAWFYDSGEPDTFGGVIAAPSSPSDPFGSAEFGIFPSERFGGHGGGSTHYTYYTGTGDWARQNSGIARSKGWHEVIFQFTPTGGSIHFDNKLVAKSPKLKTTRLLLLGNPWAGTRPMYFDDVSIVALPEPTRK